MILHVTWLRPSVGEVKISMTQEQANAFWEFARWGARFKPKPSDYSLTVDERPADFEEAIRMARTAQARSAAEDAEGRRRVSLKPNGRRPLWLGVCRRDE